MTFLLVPNVLFELEGTHLRKTSHQTRWRTATSDDCGTSRQLLEQRFRETRRELCRRRLERRANVAFVTSLLKCDENPDGVDGDGGEFRLSGVVLRANVVENVGVAQRRLPLAPHQPQESPVHRREHDHVHVVGVVVVVPDVDVGHVVIVVVVVVVIVVVIIVVVVDEVRGERDGPDQEVQEGERRDAAGASRARGSLLRYLVLLIINLVAPFRPLMSRSGAQELLDELGSQVEEIPQVVDGLRRVVDRVHGEQERVSERNLVDRNQLHAA